MKVPNKNILFIFLIVVFTVNAPNALAAEYFFEAETPQIRPGSRIAVPLFINSEGESLNAFEADVLYPQEVFTFIEARDPKSLVTFWVEAPTVTETGTIHFAGITPGGFNGQKGLVSELVFNVKGDAPKGIAILNVTNASALLNDGLGTEAVVTTSRYDIEVTEDVAETGITTEDDTVPPEAFTITRARSEHIFDGAWFVVFATRDKGTGVDHYEIAETKRVSKKLFRNEFKPKNDVVWEIASSPYVLKDQTLKQYVFVKAVDKHGNEYVAVLKPERTVFSVYLKEIIFGILVLILLIIPSYVWHRRRVRG